MNDNKVNGSDFLSIKEILQNIYSFLMEKIPQFKTENTSIIVKLVVETYVKLVQSNCQFSKAEFQNCLSSFLSDCTPLLSISKNQEIIPHQSNSTKRNNCDENCDAINMADTDIYYGEKKVKMNSEEEANGVSKPQSYLSYLFVYCQYLHFFLCPTGCSQNKYCMWFRRLYIHSQQCKASCNNLHCIILKKLMVYHNTVILSQERKEEIALPIIMDNDLSFLHTPNFYHLAKEELFKSYCKELEIKPTPTPLSLVLMMNFSEYSECIQDWTSPWWKPNILKTHIIDILNHITLADRCALFHHAVNISWDGCSDYYQVIKHEMDIEKMKNKALRNGYRSIRSFYKDFELMIENCYCYNAENSDIINYAKIVMDIFNVDYADLSKIDQSLYTKYLNQGSGRICSLCHSGDIQNEPTLLQCSYCLKPILYGHRYFVDKSLSINCCKTCFCNLSSNSKHSLILRQHREITYEPWVTCYYCRKWFHSHCLLIHPHLLSQQQFACPSCSQDFMLTTANTANTENMEQIESSFPSVNEMKQCELSCFIEERIKKLIHQEREKTAFTYNMLYEDVEAPTNLSIRVLYNEKKEFSLSPWFQEYFKEIHFPDSIGYWQKCICLFQRQHGIDMLLFVMFVFEYEEEESTSFFVGNTKCSYISYFDSVYYLSPSSYRKKIHQEIIMSYFDFIKLKGFERVYIWICPPTKGDEYIFFHHPPEQRMSSSKLLNTWYYQLFEKAIDQEIVYKVYNILEYLSDQSTIQKRDDDLLLLSIPFFPGDYCLSTLETKWIQLTKQQKPLLKKQSQQRDQQKHHLRSNHQEKQSNQDIQETRETRETRETQDISPKRNLYPILCETLKNKKNNFIILHLQPQCSFCLKMITGNDYFCKKVPFHKSEKNMYLKGNDYCCYSCYQILSQSEQQRFEKVTTVRKTEERNEIVRTSTLFCNRQTFLLICQENHLQFDTLQRAMYSSYMIHHFNQHPERLISPSLCSICNSFIYTENQWHCLECNSYSLCNDCYIRFPHPHKLFSIPSSSSKEQDASLSDTPTHKPKREQKNSFLHVCCTSNQSPFNHNTILKEQVNRFLNHTIVCVENTCGSSFCNCFQDCLYHSFTCKKQNCQKCFVVQSLLKFSN